MSFYISCSFVAWPTVGEVLLVTNWFILKQVRSIQIWCSNVSSHLGSLLLAVNLTLYHP